MFLQETEVPGDAVRPREKLQNILGRRGNPAWSSQVVYQGLQLFLFRSFWSSSKQAVSADV